MRDEEKSKEQLTGEMDEAHRELAKSINLLQFAISDEVTPITILQPH
ncbi:MAG: hypothetical protein WCA08_11620 [Desulfoferrobacter sp.]